MKKIYFLIILLFIVTFSQARDFKFEEVRKTLVLKDGSVLFGKINLERCTDDSISFSTKYLKNAMIDKKGVKFFGSNLNSGIMAGIIPFYNFKAGKKYSLTVPFVSTMSTFNANVSSGLDFVYFAKHFKKVSDKYLFSGSSDSNGEIIHGKYKYQAYLLVPTYTFRINVIPDEYKARLDRVNVYPYLGLGVGYDIGWMRYQITEVDSLEINGHTVDVKDIEDLKHMFLGLNYKFSIGVSYKIIDRITAVFEVLYYNSKFKQSLSDVEDKAKMDRETFKSNGYTIVLGFRFGKF